MSHFYVTVEDDRDFRQTVVLSVPSRHREVAEKILGELNAREDVEPMVVVCRIEGWDDGSYPNLQPPVDWLTAFPPHLERARVAVPMFTPEAARDWLDLRREDNLTEHPYTETAISGLMRGKAALRRRDELMAQAEGIAAAAAAPSLRVRLVFCSLDEHVGALITAEGTDLLLDEIESDAQAILAQVGAPSTHIPQGDYMDNVKKAAWRVTLPPKTVVFHGSGETAMCALMRLPTGQFLEAIAQAPTDPVVLRRFEQGRLDDKPKPGQGAPEAT